MRTTLIKYGIVFTASLLCLSVQGGEFPLREDLRQEKSMDAYFRAEGDFSGNGILPRSLTGDDLEAWMKERKKFIYSDGFYVEFRKLAKTASDGSDFWELVSLSNFLKNASIMLSNQQADEKNRLKCDYIKLLSDGLGADQYENAKRAYCVATCRRGSGKRGDSDEAAKFIQNLYNHGFDSRGAVRLEDVDEYVMWKYGLEEKDLKGSSEKNPGKDDGFALKEPFVYREKTVEDWLEQVTFSFFAYDYSHAVETLKEISPDRLVPELCNGLKSDNRIIQLNAAFMLGEIGSAAEPAIDDLLVALEHFAQTRLEIAAQALGLIGKRPDDCVPALVALLSDESQPVRVTAVEAIGQFKTSARPYYDGWKTALSDNDEQVRIIAMDTLVLAEIEKEEVFRQLTLQLHHKDSNVQKYAVKHLGNYGSSARKLIPEIRQLLNHKDDEVRLASAVAIGKVDPSLRDEVISIIFKLSQSKEYYIQMGAIEALFAFAPDEYPIMPKLLALTESNDIYDRINGVERILELDKTWNHQAIPILQEALKSDKACAQCRAAYLLGEIGPPAKAAVPSLMELINSHDEDVQGTALKALKKIQL